MPTPSYKLFAPPLALAVLVLCGCVSSSLKPWHQVELDQEYSLEKADAVRTLEDYMDLEDLVFRQLNEKIYDQADPGEANSLWRYSPGSAADPRLRDPNWNRTFKLATASPQGGVLLLHGMSDSPYSLRAIGQALHDRGFEVLGLRMPGHGTAPSGMTSVHWQDMSEAVSLGMRHLINTVNDKPVHIVGYSTGAALALDYALEAGDSARPASLVLISPAIGVHAAAALASWSRRFSSLPGLGGLAWLNIETEFDPLQVQFLRYQRGRTGASSDPVRGQQSCQACRQLG